MGLNFYDCFCRMLILVITQVVITAFSAINLVLIPFLTAYNSFVQKDQEFKSILITGGSRGIGRAIAEIYAKEGVHLFLIARKEKKLEEVKKSCEAKGAIVHTFVSDVTDKDRLEECVKAADKICPLDLVIPNAGVSNGDDHQFVIDVNISGVLSTIEPAIKLMKTRKKGHLCFVGSTSSYMGGWSSEDCYCATKTFVLAYGRALRVNLAEFGIGVTVVCPGLFLTDMSRPKLAEKEGRVAKWIASKAPGAAQCAQHIEYANRRNIQDYAFPAQTNFVTTFMRASWRRSGFKS